MQQIEQLTFFSTKNVDDYFTEYVYEIHLVTKDGKNGIYRTSCKDSFDKAINNHIKKCLSFQTCIYQLVKTETYVKGIKL